MGGMMMPPISVTATMLRRCARLSGVSRGTSTRRRRSLRTTSAARDTRSSACACATAASVFIEQGAITMPSVMPTISRLGMARSLPAKALVVVFCPFAAGYFLSYFFRNVNAIISKDLTQEFALTPADLGFLTSMYLAAFAAFQLPLGVLLDRYGPRRTVAALLCLAAVGAALFALGRDLAMLSFGRALIGLGVSAGLMGAIKAFSLWFPLERLATLNGLYLAVGGLGALSATAPAAALVAALGWRGMFWILACLAALVALVVYFVVPEKPLPGEGQTIAGQLRGFGRVFGT